MSDPRLDRLPEFDPRSREYAVRTLLPDRPPRSFTWNVPVALDQGRQGACVGFAWAHEIAARPQSDPSVTDATALALYWRARELDEWPGEAYDGSSVLAGAKAAVELGAIAMYRWAFGLDETVRSIGTRGPAVLGLNWYTGMMRPESDGRIRPTGDNEGGHAILAPRVTGERYRIAEQRRRVYVYNSWGVSDGWPWGWLSWDDAERLLAEQGEACIPQMRSKREG